MPEEIKEEEIKISNDDGKNTRTYKLGEAKYTISTKINFRSGTTIDAIYSRARRKLVDVSRKDSKKAIFTDDSMGDYNIYLSLAGEELVSAVLISGDKEKLFTDYNNLELARKIVSDCRSIYEKFLLKKIISYDSYFMAANSYLKGTRMDDDEINEIKATIGNFRSERVRVNFNGYWELDHSSYRGGIEEREYNEVVEWKSIINSMNNAISKSK